MPKQYDAWATAPAWAVELWNKLEEIEASVREIQTMPRLIVRLGQPTDKEIK